MKKHAISSGARGFTLVEVLLGILILAIGLLGLAAVFPLVVKQQREAQDSVVGVSASRGAQAILAGHAGLNSAANLGNAGEAPKAGWAKLSWELYKVAFNNKDSGRAPWSESFRNFDGKSALYDDAGILKISNDRDPQNDSVIRPVDRLIPAAFSGSSPQFVWDVAPSLASPVYGTALPPPRAQPMRMTVFVRRIDPGIRVPGNKSFSQLMNDGVNSAGNRVVPVAVDPTTGNATLDGTGNYSRFLMPRVTQVYRRFDATGGAFNVLRFANASELELGAIRQVGQQLVDVDGNVFTVIALPDDADAGYSNNKEQCVVISPGFPAAYLNSTSGPNSTTRWAVELLCTPQIPAAVSSFVLRN